MIRIYEGKHFIGNYCRLKLSKQHSYQSCALISLFLGKYWRIRPLVFSFVPRCLLCVHHSGYYKWIKQPDSARARENKRLTALIRESWLESGGIYGSPRIYQDLTEAGETCSVNRVARLMNCARLKAIRSYKAPRYRAGKPAVAAKNQLNHEFNYAEPNNA